MDYVPVYRKLMWSAMKASWHHRALWFFAFFAGLAQTGAIANDVMRLAPDLKPGAFNWNTLAETWNSFSYFDTFFTTLITGTPAQVIASIVTLAGTIFLLLAVILVSQHIVLHGVHRVTKKKKHLTARELRKHVEGIHVVRLFAINTMAKLLSLSLILGGALLIRNLLVSVPEVGILGAMGVYLIVLPATFAVSAVSMKALIHIVRDDAHVLDALQKSITFFSRHWLASLEFAGLLFLVNYVMTLMLWGLLFALGSMLTQIYAASAGSVGLLMTAFTATGLSVIALFVATFGFMTTFNYSAWTEFIERFAKAPAHPKTEHVARLYRVLASR